MRAAAGGVCAMQAVAAPARSASAGFTLVELLLVLMLMALTASAVMLSLPETRLSLPQEAARFAARLQRAQAAAIIENRAYAVDVDRLGYQFSQRREGRWLPLAAPPFAASQWEPGTRALTQVSAVRIVFDPIGAADPAALELTRDGVSRVIRVDAAGEVRVEAGDDR